MGTVGDSGGSDTADEKKQDSYSKQFRKNYTVNKKGEVKEKSKIRKAIENSPGSKIIGSVADNLNYKRRLAFAEKQGLNLPSKSEEYVLSPAGRSYLDEFGYSDTLKGPEGNNDGGNDTPSQKSVEQPKVAAQMDNSDVKSDLVNADVTSPTYVEMNQEEDLLTRKKRGRKQTILTSVTGDTTKPQLSKKTLLG